MIMEILENYMLNSSSVALLPGYSTDYETIVIEEMKTLYVKQSMMSIVHESCLFIGLTTYEARKKVIAKMTAFLRKTPILFSDTKDICFFHTHGNHNLNNHWFSANHILDIHSSKNKNHCNVYLMNGMQMEVPCSKVSFQNLYNRALALLTIQQTNPSERMKRIT